MFFGSMACSCGGGAASILLLKYRRTLRLHLGVSSTTVGANLQERQVAATATCDVDHFQETSTCMTSVRSMYVWSSRIAMDQRGKVAYPARSQLNKENYNSWIGNIIISLSPWEPDNLVSRNGFVAERSKYTMLAVLSAESDAQDSVMNSQDTDRLIILTEQRHVADVRREISPCFSSGNVVGFHAAEKTRPELKIHTSTPPATLAPQHASFLDSPSWSKWCDTCSV